MSSITVLNVEVRESMVHGKFFYVTFLGDPDLHELNHHDLKRAKRKAVRAAKRHRDWPRSWPVPIFASAVGDVNVHRHEIIVSPY